MKKILILGSLISLMMGTACFGAEKDVKVNIPKDYASAKFTITFEQDGEFKADIIDPDGNSTEAIKVKNDESEHKNALTRIVGDVKAGQWTVHVETGKGAEGDEESVEVIGPETEEEVEEGQSSEISELEEGEEGTETVSQEEVAEEKPQETPSSIGKVNVKVEGSYEKADAIEGEIEVAANITGLKYYMKDNGLAVEWSDSNVGNVHIWIVDSKTHEVIDQSDSNGQKYYKEFDTTAHPEVILGVVPSTSSSISGAQKEFTVDTTNIPDADVTFEDVVITNRETIDAHLDLRKTYSTDVYVNDRKVGETTPHVIGEEDIQIPLSEGANSIRVYVIDPETGNMRSTAFSVEKDTAPITFRMANLYNNETTKAESVEFEGEIDPDFNTFKINDADIPVEGDHTFRYTYTLKEGENKITFVATDLAGNVTSVETMITRIIPKGLPVHIKLGIIIILLLIGTGAFFKLTGREIPFIGLLFKKKTKAPDELEGTEMFADIPAPEKKTEKPAKAKKFSLPSLPKRVSPENKEAKVKQDMENTFTPVQKVMDTLSLVWPIIVVLVFFTKIVFACTCASGSMEPTLNVGTTDFYNRLAYIRHDIQRGDIIAFKSDEFGKVFAKRVIGIPGDEISFENGYVVINGLLVDETDYISEDIETNCEKTFTVPDGCVFVLGDNREDSYDSRFWQNPYIPENKILGKFIGAVPFSVERDLISPVRNLLNPS